MLESVIDALRSGHTVVLATIVSSSGSTPLPAGAMMAVGPGGHRLSGSVGGGTLESSVLEAAHRVATGNPSVECRQFVLHGEEDEEAMLCGGKTTVLLERLDPMDLEVWEELERRRSAGADMILARWMPADESECGRGAIEGATGEIVAVSARLSSVSITLSPEERHGVFSQASCHSLIQRTERSGGSLLLQPVPGVQQAIIFGGGHVGRCISAVAAKAGFRVTVIDDRPEFASKERFPEASLVLSIPFESAFSELTVAPSASLLLVTRAHQYDSLLLDKALRTPAGYIGMLGSRRKVTACFDRMLKVGWREEDLRRVYAPVGLDIGASTAEEIAVSVVAEMIAVHRKVQFPVPALSSR